ncbi:XK-related protein 5 isoform X2 [Antechinus flavipes]|uniref:XK-related protein 5 isoform X2 n=1 Tax=Antechinus flavipes TaxID=38775 RepID=UPI0022361F3F|nr:XK-related protein 5 isoform X2 [Antechinus flavipes]
MPAGYLVLCALLLATEQGARLCTVVYYFYTEQYLWAWLTVSALLPGCLTQGLSYLWFLADGHPVSCSLVIIHLLHLGIWKRHWDALLAVIAKKEEPPGLGKVLLQQGDLFVLRLLEALTQMGPHLLLQTYAFIANDLKEPVSGVSAILSWSSLSLSLVSYARIMGMIKPGHLSMPWAALLCQLLWRLAMLGTRIITLVLFSQVYSCWVFVVGGAHWLVMTFWLVAQQSDIIDSTCCWRLFNLLVGAVYVFCYINFWDSPSRNRMTTFYIIMLMENIVLLLLATDFLQGASWGTMWMTAGIIFGFIIGCVSLILYYSQLHPKSTEIWQEFIRKSCSTIGSDKTEKEPSSFHCTNPEKESSLPHKQHVMTSNPSSWQKDVPEMKENTSETSSYVTLSSSQHGHARYQNVTPVVAPKGSGPSLKERGPVILQGDLPWSKSDGQEGGFRNQSTVPWRQENDAESPTGQLRGAGRGKENSTFYFSATMEGVAPYHRASRTFPQVFLEKVEVEKDQQSKSDSNPLASKPFPVTVANISPILGTGTTNHLRHSPGLYDKSQFSLPGDSSAGSRWEGPQELWGVPENRYLSVGTWVSMMRHKLRPSEEPCFTSTPKSDPKKDADRLKERLKQETSFFSE